MSDRAAVRPAPVPATTLRRPGRALAAGLAATTLAVLLAGCGGTSSTSAPATTAAGAGSSATTAAGVGSSATTTSGAAGSATTVPTPAASSTTSVATSPPATSTAGGSFCGFAQSQVAKALSAGSAFGTDPANLRQDASKFDAFEGTLLSATPAAIRPAMSGLLGFDRKLFALLARDGYDFSKVSPSSLTSLEQGEAQEAQDARTVTAYFERSCGIHIPT